FHSMRMTAFGEKIKILSSIAHCLSDQLLAVVITFGGVDHVQAGVECAVQQLSDSFARSLFIANLRSTKAKHRNVHVGFSKAPLFHVEIQLTADYTDEHG